MYRSPRRTLANVHNCVSVSLPLTEIDINVIIEKVVDAIGRTSIADIEDVDLNTFGLEDGSLLIYNDVTKTWQSSTYLDRQRIDAGEY